MIGFDFAFFYKAGQAILSGLSPYSVEGFFSPLPFALVMAPFALLPFKVAFAIWTAINSASLIVLAKKKTHLAIFFLPVLYALWVGQMDLPILALGLFGGWFGLALATLKPQLAIWLFLFWWMSGDKLRAIKAAVGAGVIYLTSTVLFPGWISEWRQSTGIISYAEHSASLFGVSGFLNEPRLFFLVLPIAAIIWIVKKPRVREFWGYVSIFNPVSNIYSLSVLVESVDLIAIVLSWLILPVALRIHTGLPFVLVPIYLVLKPTIASYLLRYRNSSWSISAWFPFHKIQANPDPPPAMQSPRPSAGATRADPL